MTNYSLEINFACAQFGLEPGATLLELQEVATNAATYKYATDDRAERLEYLIGFFLARAKFGPIHEPFERIKKSYHRQVMGLHPDLNQKDEVADEKLKAANNAFEIVDHVYREAKEYYTASEDVRLEFEQEAREARVKETPSTTSNYAPHARMKSPMEPTAVPVGVTRFLAASVPRFIRTARLSHLKLSSIIGTRVTKGSDATNFIFDIIMLPEREFLRMRMHLAVPDSANPALQRGRFAPAYIPSDVKVLLVPPEEADPESFARTYFRGVFNLNDGPAAAEA
jgi:hypothetical protein